MKRTLIIGCGYLGSRVAALLLQTGDAVAATTRRPERADELRQAGCEPVLFDVLRPSPLPAVDAVVYAVGLDRSAGASMRDVYVGGLTNALAALPGTPRLVYVSSTGVYGQKGGEEVDERADTLPTEESGRVVLDAEGVLRRQRPDAIVLRFAGIYGPGRLIRAAALRAGDPIAADPDGWLNLIHVEDGARAVQVALDRGVPGETYNVSDGRPVTRRDFFTRLADRLGAPPPRFVAGPPDVSHRRIGNRRMREELGVELRYPSYEQGLEAG